MSRGDGVINKPVMLDKISKLYKQGLTDSEIAKQLNISEQTVQKCRIKRGLRRIKNYAN